MAWLAGQETRNCDCLRRRCFALHKGSIAGLQVGQATEHERNPKVRLIQHG